MLDKVVGVMTNAGFSLRAYPAYRVVVKSYAFGDEIEVERFLDQVGTSYTQTESVEVQVVGKLTFKRK